MKTFDNVILTDADGVLFYWEHAFLAWMHKKGYKESTLGFYDTGDRYGISEQLGNDLLLEFNSPANIVKLPPMRDAIKYVKKLHEEHGFVFHCISAIAPTVENYKARWKNLKTMFGETTFERLELCSRSIHKDEILKEYSDSNCPWIEDVTENVMMGLKYGLDPILIEQHYNKEFVHPQIKRVHKWKEIYSYITGEN